jgi:TonB-dependent SusC/RagA subfamily outer membrane receptor
MKKIISAIVFFASCMMASAQSTGEKTDGDILGLLNKYFGSTISSSSIMSQASGGQAIKATRSFKIKSDTLFIFFHDPKDFLTSMPLNDTNMIPLKELDKISLVRGKGQDGSTGMALNFFPKKQATASSKKSNIYNSKIDDKQLAQINGGNVSQKLNGQATGISVGGDNSPGGTPKVRIRGISSVFANSNPLYIVDDVPISNINTINPDDIASVEILKDASSTALYGVRGANGVVLIKTKKGGDDAKIPKEMVNQDLSYTLWIFGDMAKAIRKSKDDKKLIENFNNRNN